MSSVPSYTKIRIQSKLESWETYLVVLGLSKFLLSKFVGLLLGFGSLRVLNHLRCSKLISLPLLLGGFGSFISLAFFLSGGLLSFSLFFSGLSCLIS